MREMCSNCKHAGNQFTSGYSGKPMTKCKLTGEGQFSYQSCEDWDHYLPEGGE